MDEENQKVEALKKAYADIIFNTTKEAAAKIMVAERKAYQHQREMSEAKREALNMLVRFKTMMDLKVAEEERISFNQRRKTEELEVQVHKAEEVAKDLREELKEVKEELQKIKNCRMKPLGKRSEKRSITSITTNEDAAQEKQLVTCEALLFDPWDSRPGLLSSSNTNNAHLHQRRAIDHCSSASENISTRTGIPSNSADENFDVDNPDLLSMMRRIIDPHLNRSVCTQRIRAFKRDRLNGKSSPPVNSDNQSSCKKNKVQNTGLLKQNPPRLVELQKDNSWDRRQDAKFFRVPCRKRGTRFRKARTTPFTIQIMKAPVGTTLSRCRSDPCTDNSVTKSIEDPSRKTEETDNEASVFPSNPVPPFKTTNMDTNLGVDVRSDAETIEAKSIHNAANGDKLLRDESPLATEENKDTDSSEIPDLILDLKNVHKPLMSSDTKDDKNYKMTNGAPAQSADDKFLKTFRRKRKRTSLTSLVESASLESNSSTKRPSEMQSNGPEPPKSSLTVESSRDDRRLMLVARQLISLKEKKRWQ